MKALFKIKHKPIKTNESDKSIAQYFGVNLAELLGDKIHSVYRRFNKQSYIDAVKSVFAEMSYSQRILLHAEQLQLHLPKDYPKAIQILMSTLGEENPDETGMFTNFYWIMPIGKFVEIYGLNHLQESMLAIEAITKRNTGEYAIRPFIKQYPQAVLKTMTKWAKSNNFHLRRLASEGLRPKLPWATKLDLFINNPQPVFKILELLKEDEVMFVKKSVANHLTDWLKVNKIAATALINQWATTNHPQTNWIIKRATRKINIDE